MKISDLKQRRATSSDEAFLRKLHKAVYQEVVEQQFGKWGDDAQASFFAKAWLPDKTDILEIAGQPIGCIRIEERPDHLFFAEIQILPEFQGRGIGSKLIQTEMERARQLQKPLRLQVLRKNEKARALYERLGFTVYGTTTNHFLLSTENEKKTML